MEPARNSLGGFISIKEMASRSYQLKINYLETMNFRPGSFLKSPVFSVGGYEWMLFYYPKGKEPGDPAQGASIALYVFLRTIAKNVNAIFDFTLVENNGSLSAAKTKRLSQVFSNDTSPSHDVSDRWVQFFMQDDEIEKYLLDSHIVIMCIVTIMVSDSTRQAGSSFATAHSLEYREHFAKLWHDKDMLDVTFLVNEELFQAHKLVLAARSPVFKNMLFGPTQTDHSDRIHINNIQPSIFKMLLHFIYTDSVTDDQELGDSDATASIAITQQLLAAADRYALTRLKLMCEETLCTELSVDTFATIVALAEQRNCPRLREACLYFASDPENLSKIAVTDEYTNLSLAYPSFLRELRDRLNSKST
ncbi:BTB/POZ and MATH domain-containing protein 2-like [Carex rostrata]